MSYRQLAGIGALCLTIFLGVARAELLMYYEVYPEPRDRDKANTDAIRDLAVSPDGKTLVCAGRGGFFFYNAETGKRLDGLPEKVEYATGVAFAPDGKSLYTADNAGNLLRWDLDKRKVAFRYPQVHSTIERIALSADGSTLASTDGTHTVFWDARTGKFLHAWSPPPATNNYYAWGGYRRGRHRYEEPERPPQTIRFHLALSPDGRWCAAGRTPQAFHVRGANADVAKHTWPDDSVASIDVAPDGKSYAVSTRGGGIEIVASQSLRPILGCKSPCSDCFIRFAPDGKTLIGHQPDLGVLAALDAATGKVRWQRQQAPAWRSTALAFAGPKQLVTGDSDRRLRVYDLASGTIIRTIELPAEPKKKEKEAPAIGLPAWMREGDIPYLLLDQPAPPQTPISSPNVRQRLGTPNLWYPAPLGAGVFLNEGKELLVMPQGTAPIVFDTQTGKPIRRLDELHEKVTYPRQVAVSADRRRMFIGSAYHLFVWDLVKHRIEHEYVFSSEIVALAVARDGKRFAVAGQAEMHCPQPIFVGSTDALEIQALEGHEFTIALLAFSADGKRLFSASPHRLRPSQNVEGSPGLITEWDLSAGKAVRSHHHEMNQFACSPDAKLWALQEGNQVVCHLFDWQQQKIVGQIESRAETFAFTPDGAALATGGADQVVQLWDAHNGKLLRKFRGHVEQGTGLLCFSDDGRLLATHEITKNGTSAGSLRLWEVKTGAEVCVNPGHRGPIQRVAYSPDGRLIASAGDDRRILWWDAKTGRMMGESKAEPIHDDAPRRTPEGEPAHVVLKGHLLPIEHLCFSADGSTLASACARNIFVWNTATHKLIGQLPTGDGRTMKCMGLSADGKQVVTVSPSGAVDTWDATTGKKRAHFKLWPLDPDGDSAPLVHGVLSPDATHLAVFPPNATEILVYHVGSGKMVRCLAIAPPRDPEGSYMPIPCLAMVFSADGRYLAGSVQEGGGSRSRWNRFDAAPPSSSIHVWELAAGAKTTVIRAIPGTVNTLAFSPDGRSLLHGISTSSTRFSGYEFSGEWSIHGQSAPTAGAVVRDLTAGTELKQFMGTGPACVCMTTGWELPILPGAFERSGCFAFAPDGQSALTCDRDRTLLQWDARVFAPAKAPAIKLVAAEQDAAWADLALLDGKKVHLAIGQLTRDPEGTLALLKSRLALPALPPAQRVQELIRALGSEHFTVRAAALRELEQCRELVEPALREALANERDPQCRRGLEALLTRIGEDLRPECLRERRAIEVLEKLDDAGARAWLAELAGGPAHARLTRAAGAALARLRMRAAFAD